METIHEGLSYSCDKCDFKTKNKDNLREHIGTDHEKILVEEQNEELNRLQIKISKLEENNCKLKKENSRLLLKNNELEVKLEEKGTKANLLIDNLQTIHTLFCTTENSDLVKRKRIILKML